MPDGLLALPTTPPGMDPDRHLRNVLGEMCAEIDGHLDRLHRAGDVTRRDEEADVSTVLRELRPIVQDAIADPATSEDELHDLLGAVASFSQRAEHLHVAADLRTALSDDPEQFDAVEQHALAIGDICGAAFMQYVTNDVRNVDRFHRIECQARVPLMHAFMRAVTSGILDAPAALLHVDDMEAEADRLIEGVLDRFPPVEPHAPMRHQRVAALASTVLWNVVRRARKTAVLDLCNESIALRGRSIEPLRADVRYQAQRLDTMPDFNFWYDVGLGLGMLTPMLERMATQQELVTPARPDVYVWWSMLGTVLRER